MLNTVKLFDHGQLISNTSYSKEKVGPVSYKRSHQYETSVLLYCCLLRFVRVRTVRYEMERNHDAFNFNRRMDVSIHFASKTLYFSLDHTEDDCCKITIVMGKALFIKKENNLKIAE